MLRSIIKLKDQAVQVANGKHYFKLNKMRKLFFIISVLVVWCSCNTSNHLPGFDFKLFKGTPIYELAKAVEKEDLKQIEIILRDTTMKVDFHEPKFGNTLLMLAVANNKKKAIKKLLAVGANPNERDYYDNATPLIYACDNFSEDCDSTILKLMIDYHGDVNSIQSINRIENTGAHSLVNNTCLMIAAKNNCLGIIKVLVNSGADINRYTYYEGYGVITQALIQDNIEIAKYLIIDRQAKIPEYCYIRNKGGEDEQKLTITDMLNEQQYEPGSNNYNYRKEIISYLKSKDLK
jgi:hypothetical protein